MDDNNLDDFQDEKERLKEFYKNKKKSDDSEDLEQQEEKKSKKKWIPILLKYGLATLAFSLVVGFSIFIADNYIIPDMINTRRLVMVPKLEGLSLDSAMAKLDRRNIKGEVLKKQFDKNTKKDVVLKQNPEVGKKIREQRTVYLTLSLGSEKVEVPQIAGLSLRTARIQLLNQGLNLGKVKYKFHESVPADTLITQSIKAGEMIDLGDEVEILVSKGSENELLVPNLVEKDYEQVLEILKEYNLQLGSVTYVEDDTFLPGTVIGQFPPAGEKTIKNSFIDLDVVQGSGEY